ncbi:MAG: metal ABC transporter ATP-binding protein [Opitutales bacterium]
MSSTAIPPLRQSGTQDLSASEALSKGVPLKIRDLTVAYHRKPVVWDVDFTVPSAQLVALVGPNGAGKSTLMKACLDLIPRTSGEVFMLGRPYDQVRQRVAYVPQRESVDWEFPVSALEVVTMGLYAELGWLRRVNKGAKARAMAALERVGLAELAQHQIGQLSGGQQQRVFLARALVQSAELYFMDEPFAAVDAATERAIIEVLRTLRQQGKTVIVIHHDLSTVPHYFDWTVMMNMRIVAAGPTAQVFNQENLRKTYGGHLTLMAQAADAMIHGD